MNNITITETQVLEIIQQFTDKVHQFIGLITNKINDINSKTNPLSEVNYENAYNLIETCRERNRNFSVISTDIQRENDNFHERVNTLDKLLDNFELALNQNKLKFGLQGLIKRNLKDDIKNLAANNDEDIGSPELEVLNAPYSITPFEPQSIGGKNIKSKNKHKSKKSRYRKLKRRTKRRN
jgi:hypothetical protein